MEIMKRKLNELEHQEGKEYTICRLGYNSSNNRFGILFTDIWQDIGLHCGDQVIYWDTEKEEWIYSRVEMDFSEKWYIVGASIEHGCLEYEYVLFPSDKIK